MQTRKPKLGILLPTRGLLLQPTRPTDADSILAMAEAAEEANLDSVWVGDSLIAKPRLEPLTALAAVAARTQRVRLGTAVMLAALRHPVPLAQTVGTLDLISKGRLVLAVGVGGAFNEAQQREWQAVGVNPRQRAGRLEELIAIVKGLGAGEEVSHHGWHFNLDSVTMQPTPVQQGGVPILIACHGRLDKDEQFRRAARLGNGIISVSDSPEEYSYAIKRVKDYASQEGRDWKKMEAAFYLTVNLNNDQAKAAEEADRYLMGYYGANIWGDRWGPFGPPERCVERIQEYVDAGADTIIVRFASFDQSGQLEAFVKEVLPAFR